MLKSFSRAESSIDRGRHFPRVKKKGTVNQNDLFFFVKCFVVVVKQQIYDLRGHVCVNSFDTL